MEYGILQNHFGFRQHQAQNSMVKFPLGIGQEDGMGVENHPE
jgi:hypothetical protein